MKFLKGKFYSCNIILETLDIVALTSINNYINPLVLKNRAEYIKDYLYDSFNQDVIIYTQNIIYLYEN